jgi:outer membrane immunogenic protein
MMTNTGIRGLLGLACGIGLATMVAVAPATAADLTAPPFKAAPAEAAYNWSGFYVGATLGGGMASLPVTDKDNFTLFNGGPLVDGQTLKSGGAVGGVHAGYNWQFAPSILVGLEGDFNWASFRSTDTTCQGFCSDPAQDQLVTSSKLDKFGTLRARFGLTSDRALIYLTAGPAWGHVNASVAVNCPLCGSSGMPLALASDSSFHVGLAVGGGVEYALTQNWLLRAEYMHLDFSNKDTVFQDVFVGLPFVGFRASSTATADIARIGVSYKVW